MFESRFELISEHTSYSKKSKVLFALFKIIIVIRIVENPHSLTNFKLDKIIITLLLLNFTIYIRIKIK